LESCADRDFSVAAQEIPGVLAMPDPFAPDSRDVLKAELDQIDKRRRERGLEAPETGSPESAEKEASNRQLIGLAFSGGGIRSATFNLGFLQGLAGLGILKFFDYLSTVSGGGYVGGFLAAWMQRQGPAEVEDKLQPTAPPAKDDELDPIRHLRRYSNYLAPNRYLLSADRWVLWAIYLRNFLLNQLVLLPAAFALMLVARLLMLTYYPLVEENRGFLYDGDGNRFKTSEAYFAGFMAAFAGLALIGLLCAFVAAAAVRTKERPDGNGLPAWTPSDVRWYIVLPLVLAAAAFCYIGPYAFPLSWELAHRPANREADWLPPWWVFDFVAFALFAAVLTALAFALACAGRMAWSWRIFWWCCLTGGIWGALLYGVFALINWFFAWDTSLSMIYVQMAGTALVTTFGPPLTLLSIIVAFALGVGVLRGRLPEELREWWASISARLLMVAAVWMSVNLVALYGTALVLWAGPWVQTALASGWAFTVLSGVLAGASARTDGGQQGFSYLDLLARFALHVFVAGIFILVSLLVHVALDNAPELDLGNEVVWPYRYEPAQPETHISVRRTGTDGKIMVQRKREYMRIPNEAAAIQQQYWFGMLNSGDQKADVSLYFEEHDIEKLREAIKRDPVLQIAPEDSPERQAAVKKKLDDLLKRLEAFWPENPKFEREKRWHFEELQDKIDETFPEAWQQPIRRLIMQRAKGGGAFLPFHKAKVYFKLFAWLAGCLVVLWIGLRRVDVNVFSLQALYANRLTRAYLGASRKRSADPVTKFDPEDDLAIRDLRDDADKPYLGPYPIVNAALNLVHGGELSWQERKAAAFVFTPHYCGSDATGYSPTVLDKESDDGTLEKKTYAGNLSLGTAVAISGAAASPNSGYHSSPTITFLLTVFNARLGSWLGNPNNDATREHRSPWWGMGYLFKEMIGWTDANSPYVYLSDGGHFENLGVYELIKRRCRYIVVCDAGQDETHAFEDLGNLIRKVRIDLNISIEISPDFLHLQKEPRHTRWHCSVGKIRYDEVDKDTVPGMLLYVKPSLTGDEPADVLHYAASHPAFPHETTANQFYSESQFESYRALGQHIAEAVFKQSIQEMDTVETLGARAWCRELFCALERHWFALPPHFEAKFVQSTYGFIDVQEAFRADPRLWRLTLDLYPELPEARTLAAQAPTETEAAQKAADLHVILQMLQVMENAYLSLNLAATYAHPLNRGWLDVFHRWTSAATFRRHWPLVRAEFGRDFVAFCERQMLLGIVVGVPFPLTVDTPLDRLLEEFGAQWPEHHADFQHLIRSEESPSDADPGARPQAPKRWAIYPRRRRDNQADYTPPGPSELPAGIIVVDEDPQGMHEFHVWLRGAYRNTGLGRPAVQAVLDQLRRRWPDAFQLRVRLPIADLTGPGGKLQFDMWLTFFNHLEFRRDDSASPDVLDLVRNFPRQPGPGAGAAEVK
jgi:hypothetical protein